jgi:hypothetical protein
MLDYKPSAFSASPNATLDQLTAVPSEVVQYSHSLKKPQIFISFYSLLGDVIFWPRLRAWVSQKVELLYNISSSRRGVEPRRRRAARRESRGARKAWSTREACRRRELAREARRSCGTVVSFHASCHGSGD